MPDISNFKLEQITGRSLVRLRVRPEIAPTVAVALKLPHALCFRGDDPVAHWLGPDQWLLASDNKPAGEILESVDSALSGRTYAAVDTSSANVCLRLSGSAARNLLAMGCGIDMHHTAFVKGQCIRTNFAQVALFIAAVDDDCFELYVDRSLGQYLRDWLLAASEDPSTQKLNRGLSKLSEMI